MNKLFPTSGYAISNMNWLRNHHKHGLTDCSVTDQMEIKLDLSEFIYIYKYSVYYFIRLLTTSVVFHWISFSKMIGILFLSILEVSVCIYRPSIGDRFQWQLQVDDHHPFDHSMHADLYDVDLWAVTAQDISAIHG